MFLLDVLHVPYGCSVWPGEVNFSRLANVHALIIINPASLLDHGYGEFSTSYRDDPLTPTVGEAWPIGGEIDIVEMYVLPPYLMLLKGAIWNVFSAST